MEAILKLEEIQAQLESHIYFDADESNAVQECIDDMKADQIVQEKIAEEMRKKSEQLSKLEEISTARQQVLKSIMNQFNSLYSNSQRPKQLQRLFDYLVKKQLQILHTRDMLQRQLQIHDNPRVQERSPIRSPIRSPVGSPQHSEVVNALNALNKQNAEEVTEEAAESIHININNIDTNSIAMGLLTKISAASIKHGQNQDNANENQYDYGYDGQLNDNNINEEMQEREAVSEVDIDNDIPELVMN